MTCGPARTGRRRWLFAAGRTTGWPVPTASRARRKAPSRGSRCFAPCRTWSGPSFSSSAGIPAIMVARIGFANRSCAEAGVATELSLQHARLTIRVSCLGASGPGSSLSVSPPSPALHCSHWRIRAADRDLQSGCGRKDWGRAGPGLEPKKADMPMVKTDSAHLFPNAERRKPGGSVLCTPFLSRVIMRRPLSTIEFDQDVNTI